MEGQYFWKEASRIFVNFFLGYVSNMHLTHTLFKADTATLESGVGPFNPLLAISNQLNVISQQYRYFRN